jgi:hypothetical protein
MAGIAPLIAPAIGAAAAVYGAVVSTTLIDRAELFGFCNTVSLADHQTQKGGDNGTGDAEKHGVEDHQPDATSPMSVSLVSGASVWSTR